MDPKIKIGTCAWSFDDWRGSFYPPHLPHHHWLEFYARHFHAVEVDSTYYHTPSDRALAHWVEQTPSHFRFVCKAPCAITHEGRLRDCREKMDAFLEAISQLGDKLAGVLIQLPCSFSPRHDEGALRDFVRHLPPAFRYAIEFRRREWHLPRIVHLLEEQRICWVWNDTSPLSEQNRGPFEFLPQTTDFIYVRLLGNLATKYRVHPHGQLVSRRDSALESWAMKIHRHIAESKDIFAFANNHFEGFSPLTCQRLAHRLGAEIRLPIAEIEESAMENPQLELPIR